jgi:hypothetical protein
MIEGWILENCKRFVVSDRAKSDGEENRASDTASGNNSGGSQN